jgi:hypothetical protein
VPQIWTHSNDDELLCDPVALEPYNSVAPCLHTVLVYDPTMRPTAAQLVAALLEASTEVR